jgi:hypothetical protein
MIGNSISQQRKFYGITLRFASQQLGRKNFRTCSACATTKRLDSGRQELKKQNKNKIKHNKQNSCVAQNHRAAETSRQSKFFNLSYEAAD